MSAISELDKLLESEYIDEIVNNQAIREHLKEQQKTYIAKFQIDINNLYKKNDNTFYTKASYLIKDGIVFKFNRGIPALGESCIVIMKYDIRNKYHDYEQGAVKNGHIIKLGNEIMPSNSYGSKPIVYIYPTKTNEETNLTITLISAKLHEKIEFHEDNDNKIVDFITGSDVSSNGEYGNIHRCYIIKGNPFINLYHSRIFYPCKKCNINGYCNSLNDLCMYKDVCDNCNLWQYECDAYEKY